MNCHIMYTTINAGFRQIEIDLPSLAVAEAWAAEQGATYWEISVLTPLRADAARHEQAEQLELPAAPLKHDG